MSNATPFCDTHNWMCPTICILPFGPFMVHCEAQWPGWPHLKQFPGGTFPPAGWTAPPAGTNCPCCCGPMGFPVGVDCRPCHFAPISSFTTCHIA